MPKLYCSATPLGLLIGLLAVAAPCRSDVVLVRDGKPAAAIVLPANAVEDERLAAREIQEHVAKISGARLPISAAAPAGQVPIRIGGARPAVPGLGEDPSSFALIVRPEGVTLAGRTAAGTLIAAYELLEQLGCRWYMPGEIGTVIPHSTRVRLAEQQMLQTPSFPSRHLQGIARSDPWYRRMRLGGPYFAGAHGLGFKADLATEPELFSLVDGQRKARQWCLTHPEVLRRTVAAVKERLRQDPSQPWFGIGPNDGGGHCECAACRALDAGDWDFFAGQVSKTDRYIHFFNQVLAEVRKEFPGKKLAFYIYADYFRPPVREKPDRDIVPALAPITLCRIHSALNPLCPERGYLGRVLDGWSKLLPEIYYRGYYFNLADPGFPFSLVSRLRDEIPYFKAKNVSGFRVECLPAWGSHTPTLYVATRLFWKHDADVDGILDDFTTRFFGPAAEPMRRYLTRMDAALHQADYHTGGAVDLPLFYTADVRRQARAELEEARRRARPDALIAHRVAMFRLTFDYLEAFLAMREHTNAVRFGPAREALDRMETLRKQAAAHQPPLVDPEKSEEYTRRFWSEAVVQGSERTTGGSELAAALPDRWDVELDPAQAGEEMGFFRPRPRVDSRMTLATSSASWGDQGLRYYRGAAWYRARVTIPAKYLGRRLLLWFGGVDEQAKVWVNGKLVGDGPRGAFRPFEFDATEAARPGALNDVVVRVNNLQLNELGTGGITGPVMFWSPAAGKEKGPKAESKGAAMSKWNLVWSDEFNQNGPPDPRNWGFETGFVRNNELQWYQAENARCRDGLLVIEARRERKANPSHEPGSADWRRSREYAGYTSASLTTRGLQSWRYGRFEMRARIDSRLGLWPAFWTLGVAGEWPGGGEIDIMEYYRGTLLANAAWGTERRWVARWDSTRKPLGEFDDPEWSSKFHVWRMDWEENAIQLSVDDLLLNTVDLTKTFNTDKEARNPFRQPHFLLLSLAVGGKNGGDPSQTTFPARFEVDYVRVYQRR